VGDSANKVGEVYVEIKATGGDNIAKEVQRGQAKAEQQAHSGGGLPALGGGSGGAAGLLRRAAMTAGGGGVDASGGALHDVQQWASALGNVEKELGKIPAAANAASKSTSLFSSTVIQALSKAGTLVGIPSHLSTGLLRLIPAAAGATAAITAVVGAIGFGVYKWIEAKKALKEAEEEIQRTRLAWNQFTKDLVTPPGELEKTFSLIDAEANKTIASIHETMEKKKSIFNSYARAYEEYLNDEARILNQAEGTKRAIVRKSDQERLKESIKASEQEAIARWATVNEVVAKERQAREARIKEVEKAEQDAVIAELEGVTRLQKEKEIAIDALSKKRADALEIGNYEEAEYLAREIAAATKVADIKIGIAQREEDEKARIKVESARRAAQEAEQAMEDVRRSSNQSIFANSFGGQSASLQELTSLVRDAVEAIRRNN